MKTSKTIRGFDMVNFEDMYDVKCHIQKSSLATDDAIWFGIDFPDPKIMVSQAKACGIDVSDRTGEELNGWMPYPIPDEVQISTAMHLSRDQVKALLPVLEHFANTGEIVSPDDGMLTTWGTDDA